MNWIRSTLTDDDGRFDVAYVSLFGVMGATMGAVLTMCVMAVIAYFRCHTFEVNGVFVNCTFDPQPLGTAIGFACGGFGTALGALAGYMLATRPQRPQPPAQQPSPVNIQMQPPAAQPAKEPLQVDVVGVPGSPPPRARKGTRKGR